jgi:hypothetical protein
LVWFLKSMALNTNQNLPDIHQPLTLYQELIGIQKEKQSSVPGI